MKIKIRRTVTKKALKDVRRLDTSSAWLRELREARFEGIGSLKRIVSQQWALHFGGEPPEGIHLVLLETKLGYHIEHEQKKAQGLPIVGKFLRNYKAAMEFSLQGFDADMRFYLELGMKYQGVSPEKEEEMKVKRKAAAVKAQATKAKSEVNKGPKKGATWVGLFQANYKKQLTDAELAKAMTKAMGDGHSYTEQEVVKNRGFFNFGGFGAKYPKPKTALQQFKDEPKDGKKSKK